MNEFNEELLKQQLDKEAEYYSHDYRKWSKIHGDLMFQRKYTFNRTPPGDWLELGLADGHFTEELMVANTCKTLTTLEGSKTFIDKFQEFIRQDNANGFWHKFTAVHTLFETYSSDKKYNTIWAILVLEHLDDPVFVLQKCKEWLAPGGRINILVPNANSIHRHVGVSLGLLSKTNELHDGDIALGHKRIYDRELLRTHVSEAGLNIYKEGGLFLKPWSGPIIESLNSYSINDLIKFNYKNDKTDTNLQDFMAEIWCQAG